jgi:hypothetical protein
LNELKLIAVEFAFVEPIHKRKIHVIYSLKSLRYGLKGVREIRLHMGDKINHKKNPSRESGYGRLQKY